MNIDSSIRFIAQALNDHARTLSPAASESFSAVASQHFSVLVSAAQQATQPAMPVAEQLPIELPTPGQPVPEKG